MRKARGRPRRRWSSRNQGGVACGVGLSVGCMVSKLYEYVFAAVGTGVGVHTPSFGGPPPSSQKYVSSEPPMCGGPAIIEVSCGRASRRN